MNLAATGIAAAGAVIKQFGSDEVVFAVDMRAAA